MWIVDLHKYKLISILLFLFQKALLNQHKAKFTEAQSKRRTFHLPTLIPSDYIMHLSM